MPQILIVLASVFLSILVVVAVVDYMAVNKEVIEKKTDQQQPAVRDRYRRF